MPHPETQSDILDALESNAESIAVFFLAQPDATVFTGDPDHWGPAHHLVHLTQSSAAILRGLRNPALPEHLAGHSRPYAEVRDAATTSLTTTPKPQMLEMGRVAVVPPGSTVAGLVGDFEATGAALRTAAAGWNEPELDRRAMRHPLIGVMTVREMLFFCVFHERHHLKLLQARVEAGPAQG